MVSTARPLIQSNDADRALYSSACMHASVFSRIFDLGVSVESLGSTFIGQL